jgi:hypothetical protein
MRNYYSGIVGTIRGIGLVFKYIGLVIRFAVSDAFLCIGFWALRVSNKLG